MESQTKAQQRIQYEEKEGHFTTDSGEPDSDADTSVNRTQSMALSRTSSAVKCSGDINSVSSISTSILDDAEEVKVLKEKLAQVETKCTFLENDNNRINADLIRERTRTEKLEKKLQFVKDNQEVFMRLKEAYINMKYNEAAGRKMIEIREKGLQTWEGILCKGCIEAEEMRRQVDQLRKTYNDSFIVAPYEMDQLLNTVKYLKDLIERREKTWSAGIERENKVRAHMKTLENENLTLRELIKNNQINIGELQLEETETSPELPPNKESCQFKKIIVKMEKKFRELEKCNSGLSKLSSSLNDKEKKTVQQLMAKYNSRHKKSYENIRSRSLSRETHLKKEHCPKPRSSSPVCNRKQGNDQPKMMNNMGFQCDKKAESAIMMMDYLFESESKIIS